MKKNQKNTNNNPRLSIVITNKNIHIQCINDQINKTINSFSTSSFKNKLFKINIFNMIKLGEIFAKKLISIGIRHCRYDKSNKKYHGKIKAFAESVKKHGVKL